MKPVLRGSILLTAALSLAFGQSTETPPKFEAADVHVSPKATNPISRPGVARNGRYEVKNATMLDLVRVAYGFDADKILGGPSWLEMDRFDVLAKVPAESTPDSLKLMLQSLLADRFRLVTHTDTKPLPTYALVAGKKPQLKPAEGTEETGCKPLAGAPSQGGIRMMRQNSDGTTAVINLGPGMTVQYGCRNMTMAAFAEGLRSMNVGNALGANPVLDRTGLKGSWNFDLSYSMQLIGPMMMDNSAERISIFTAVDKQLGLKLEEQQVPTPVIVVDSVNQKPSANPPGTAEALPTIPAPTEFEVASVKTADPNPQMMGFRMQNGGRLTVQGMPMQMLILRAFNVNNFESVKGLPKWADTERFDIIAKAPSMADTPGMDPEALAPLMRSLLADRFKMTYHSEDQQVSAYSLVAAKPKMKKADPSSRTFCRNSPAPPPAPQGSMVWNCQNTTMQQFADRLQNMSAELNWPVLDATELAGGWDFSLTYSRNFVMAVNMRGPDAAQTPGSPSASDPAGGITLFQALEKQLGLKLELQKRTASVIVIDHIEQKPTEN